MHFQLITLEIQDRIAHLSLNRPEVRNALNHDLVEELKQALKLLEEDDKAKVIILKGEGEAFSAGADLKYLADLQKNTFAENLEDSQNLRDLFKAIYFHPKPIIAEVAGHAIAGGCGLATVCDFVYAAEGVKFGYTETKIGFIPALVSVFLIKKIGEGKARDLLLSGRLIEAQEAKDMGLINQVFSKENLKEQVLKLASKLCKNNSGQSLAQTKNMLANLHGKSIIEGLDYASELNAHARATSDCKKGIANFLNKENIEW